MASWIVHLRIADMLAKRIDVDYEKFLVGNVAPDSGVLNENGLYVPPSSVTHWTPTERKYGILTDKFYNKYIQDIKDYKFSFYLGYWSHLITDLNWVNSIVTEIKNNMGDKYELPEIKQMVKSEWYVLDMFYLQNHPDFDAFKVLNGINCFDNVYLDYFKKDAITNSIKNICNFYNNNTVSPDREYKYLTMDRVDTFIIDVVDIILARLDNM